MGKPKAESAAAPNCDRWVEVKLKAGPETLDALSSRLIDLGSPGVALAAERENEVQGYLPDDDVLGRALDEIRRYLESLRRLGFSVAGMTTRPVPQVDWVRDFQERCTPRRIGPFHIVPESHRTGTERTRRGARGEKAAEILLSPGMAFGTGEHPTTRLCLKALGQCVSRPPPRRVLDIGCGSGILGIAAAKSFRRCRVTAVDIDPAAYHVTRRNARENRVAHRMTVHEGSLEKARGTFNLILANLYLEPLRDMTPGIAHRLAAGGLAILSGILTRQTTGLERSLEAAGLRVNKRRSESAWACLTVQRNPGDKNPLD
ncbi:MAG: 50S ribosomal protein L11 methyltransferase [Nitrospinota bacterium]